MFGSRPLEGGRVGERGEEGGGADIPTVYLCSLFCDLVFVRFGVVLHSVLVFRVLLREGSACVLKADRSADQWVS